MGFGGVIFENTNLKIQEFPLFICIGIIFRRKIANPVSPLLFNSPFVEVHLCETRNSLHFFTPFSQAPFVEVPL